MPSTGGTVVTFRERHPYPGKLIAVEGVDGSGKSTQVRLLQHWLEAQGYPVFFTEWNSSELVRDATRQGKKKNTLTPTTFSLLHATDLADRLAYQILPPLKAGMIVLSDRYVCTAFARDAVRGVDRSWVRKIYDYAPRPDLTLYFRVPVSVACERILSARRTLKFYEAGMDLGLADTIEASFVEFQGRILVEYDRVVEEYGLAVIDGQLDIREQQDQVREHVKKLFALAPMRRRAVPTGRRRVQMRTREGIKIREVRE